MNYKDRIRLSQERLGSSAEAIIAAKLEEGFACEYFATDNIKSLPACLDLRLPSGKREAIPYSSFTEIKLDPENGIAVTTDAKKIKITGRDLYKLYDYLTAFRVRYIQANIGADIKEDGLIVDEIIIEELL